jgi:hypothetical protein
LFKIKQRKRFKNSSSWLKSCRAGIAIKYIYLGGAVLMLISWFSIIQSTNFQAFSRY